MGYTISGFWVLFASLRLERAKRTGVRQKSLTAVLTQSRKVAKKDKCSKIMGLILPDMAMTENEIASKIVDASFRIHTSLGPGLLESVYETVLSYELEKQGIRVERQKPIPLVYEGIHFDEGFRADMVVEDKVVVELKSIEKVAAVHKKQLLTYLRLADKRLGMLVNFGENLIKDGITRVANGM